MTGRQAAKEAAILVVIFIVGMMILASIPWMVPGGLR